MHVTELAVAAAPRLSLPRWLAAYAFWLAALAVPAWLMLAHLGISWRTLFAHPGWYTAPQDQALKLLIFGLYISLCCTFVPMPTGPLVAALATPQVALTGSLWLTVLLVANIGAASSTIANLHDYHLFDWMLRRRWIGRVRDTRAYQRAEAWFRRWPFALLVIFNVLPIPVDAIRMLAAGSGYPLRPFAAANFIGRWVRYAVLVGVTYCLGTKGWVAVLALLAVAVVMGLAKVALHVGRRVW